MGSFIHCAIRDARPTVPATPLRDLPETGPLIGHTGVMSDEGWYYDVKTHKVSQGKDPHALNRMGPYPDRETAERALQIAAERNKAADDADDAWNN